MLLNIVIGLLIAVAGVSWFILISLPRHIHKLQMIPRIVVPVVLSFFYLVFLVTYFVTASDPFSLIGAEGVLGSELLFLTGFIHLIVFNLLVGAWISDEAYEMGMHPRLRDLVLFITSLSGPLGYLLFLIIKKRMKVSAVFV